MDAPIRRLAIGLLLGTLPFGCLGCGLLGHEVDDRVTETMADPTLPKSKTRGQSPPPVSIPPAEPSAPIVPLGGPSPQPPLRADLSFLECFSPLPPQPTYRLMPA